MPKLWTDTIEAHRQAVRDAALEAAAALAAERGLRGVTMAEIAVRAGIGRATLYKYFSDVEAILAAWHERQITSHLQQLREVSDGPGRAPERLAALLEAYASRVAGAPGRHDAALYAFLHRDSHRMAQAHLRLHDLVCKLIGDGAKAGDFRGDVAPAELATYCLHAIAAAGALNSTPATGRLVAVIVAGLRPDNRTR